MAREAREITEEKKAELIAKFKEFLRKKPYPYNDLVKAAEEEKPLILDFDLLYKFGRSGPELGELLLDMPRTFFDIAEEASAGIELPNPVKIRFSNLPDTVNIRDLRSKHIGRFLCVEGIVRKASEIRPEVMQTVWECPECGEKLEQYRKGSFIFRPFQCACGNKTGFKQVEERLIDTRWIVIEEPFELTEGERPSQVTILLTEDLVSSDMRRITEPGSRLKINGTLKEIPRGKLSSVKLDFYLDANHLEPTEIGWERLEVSKEDEEEIKKLAKDPKVYDKLVASLAPSLYGLSDEKESIILQLFGGVPRKLPDGTKFRGDVHLLMIGDPASGKSQLLKLVPEIVPRGKYVSGKGVTAAGLCMSYDTLVPLAHGQIKPIGEIVESVLDKGKKEIDGGFLSDKGNVEIICLNTNTLKNEKRRVSTFFKLKTKDNLVKLKTRTGREIRLTKENPVLTIEDGKLLWKQAKDMKPSQYIAISRKIPINEIEIKGEMTPDFSRFVGMICGDGDIGVREIRFHNTEQMRLDYVQDISKNFGVSNPRIYYQKNRIPCVRLASKNLCNKLVDMGVPRGEKSYRIEIPERILTNNRLLSEFISGLFDCDGGVVRKGKGSYIEYTTVSKKMAKQIQTTLLRFGIISFMRKKKPSKKGFGSKRIRYVISIHSKHNLETFRNKIGFKFRKAKTLDEVLNNLNMEETNVDVIPNVGHKIGMVRKGLGITIKNKRGLHNLRHYEHGRRRFTRKGLLKFLALLKKEKTHEYFNFLRILAKSDIFWDEIKDVSEDKEEWVYDLTVDGEHNFIANDLIVHNTATVSKDEQFMGGWVLEAGAIVLANKGLLSIDEFEKMTPDDQIAMHEALEQGSVSIAKASIVATLPAQTSVLAGGNPKFSRFDPYMPISKQIIIPATLLSRFDLKFALRDIPDEATDKKVVDHILKAREKAETVVPVIPVDFIKKYIAYAKEKYKPELTPEVGKLIKNFYIKTRKKSEAEGAPVSITLRQFEALIRLSEASAKIQLKDKVRKEDAQRAIKLMRYSLRQMGFDPETGKIDVDRAEGGIASSERSKIRIVLDIINELSLKKKEIPAGEIEELAKKEGIEDPEEIIEKLKREGMLFEPSPGFVQKV